MIDEFEEIQKKIGAILDEVEQNAGRQQYQPLETKQKNVPMLIYLVKIASLILRCRDKDTGSFNRKMVRRHLEELLSEKAEKTEYFVFNVLDVLKRERAVEHLKYILATGKTLFVT